jgi:hypothetical protein
MQGTCPHGYVQQRTAAVAAGGEQVHIKRPLQVECGSLVYDMKQEM